MRKRVKSIKQYRIINKAQPYVSENGHVHSLPYKECLAIYDIIYEKYNLHDPIISIVNKTLQ